MVDNEPGKTALRKGCGRDSKVNRLLACLWAFVTAEGVEPHWRRVCSSANIADGTSRGDLALAIEKHWALIKTDWDAIYDQLATCTSSLQTALNSHGKLRKIGPSGCETMASSSRATVVGRSSSTARAVAVAGRGQLHRNSQKEVRASLQRR